MKFREVAVLQQFYLAPPNINFLESKCGGCEKPIV